MTTGVATNPEWYGGLTVESSFEDFQTFFFKEGTLNGVCATPACPACHTAVRDEKCYADVKWALEKGIPEHPDTRACFGIFLHKFVSCSTQFLSKHVGGLSLHPPVVVLCFRVQSFANSINFCQNPIFCIFIFCVFHGKEWYNGLTTESSFEEVQEYFWREGVKNDCPRPCAPLCSSTGNCSAMGVNVFGFDGFEDDASVKRAVQKLFQKGVRNFRVVNVGAWADVALTAINEAAGVYPGSSVKITSLFFDSPSASSDNWFLS